MKKNRFLRIIISIALSLTLVVLPLSLSGCASSETLYLFNYGDYIDPEVYELFEKEHGIKVVYDDDDVILISEQGIIIRISAESIRECARPSKGVRLMRLSENDSVITMTLAKNSGEETTPPVETAIPEENDSDAEITEEEISSENEE